GESYMKKTSCLNGIDSIKRNAPDAEIVKIEE
ncbi:MAG: YegP family protein, partial [Ruminococcus sp.]|nr:YegP family protein [Ruminococcus sp.]